MLSEHPFDYDSLDELKVCKKPFGSFEILTFNTGFYNLQLPTKQSETDLGFKIHISVNLKDLPCAFKAIAPILLDARSPIKLWKVIDVVYLKNYIINHEDAFKQLEEIKNLFDKIKKPQKEDMHRDDQSMVDFHIK